MTIYTYYHRKYATSTVLLNKLNYIVLNFENSGNTEYRNIETLGSIRQKTIPLYTNYIQKKRGTFGCDLIKEPIFQGPYYI